MGALRAPRPLPPAVWRKIMDDYLGRAGSPLKPAQWLRLDREVTAAAQRRRVCRRFLSLYTGFGPGTSPLATHRVTGGYTPEPRGVGLRAEGIELPIFLRDITVPAGDPLPEGDIRGQCLLAADFCARVEDHLILNGHPGLGLPGLLGAPAARYQQRGPWRNPDDAFRAVAAAAAALADAGMDPPYVLVLAPDLYPVLAPAGSPLAGPLAALVSGGVYPCREVPAGTAILVAPAARHMDLAVAQDLITRYHGQVNGLHYFRVFAIVALRIKEPAAVCVLEPAAGGEA